MKIKLNELRTIIREEISRVLNESNLFSQTDEFASSVQKIINMSVAGKRPPLLTKTTGEYPSYWFDIIKLSDEEVDLIEDELRYQLPDNTLIDVTGGKMIIKPAITSSNDPNAYLSKRDPASVAIPDYNEE